MTAQLLICTDLDRTLLPNGKQPESAQARALFAALVARPEIKLAYVSGRDKALVESAISEFNLPLPDFVIADVGTSLYALTTTGWQASPQWAAEIAPDWGGKESEQLQPLLTAIADLRLQESSKQNRFKLSYYSAITADVPQLLAEVRKILATQAIQAELIYSVDGQEQIGLLDVVPARATKYHAVEFLMRQLGFNYDNTVFAGDSGNDLPVLASPIQAVLVANASAKIRQQAIELSRQMQTEEALYLARGDFLGLNGNYSAGILEGVAHYLPQTQHWMKLP